MSQVKRSERVTQRRRTSLLRERDGQWEGAFFQAVLFLTDIERRTGKKKERRKKKRGKGRKRKRKRDQEREEKGKGKRRRRDNNSSSSSSDDNKLGTGNFARLMGRRRSLVDKVSVLQYILRDSNYNFQFLLQQQQTNKQYKSHLQFDVDTSISIVRSQIFQNRPQQRTLSLQQQSILIAWYESANWICIHKSPEPLLCLIYGKS